MTSPAYVADLNGNLFRSTIYPPSVVVIALIFSELRRGAESAPHSPPIPEDPKKAQSD